MARAHRAHARRQNRREAGSEPTANKDDKANDKTDVFAADGGIGDGKDGTSPVLENPNAEDNALDGDGHDGAGPVGLEKHEAAGSDDLDQAGGTVEHAAEGMEKAEMVEEVSPALKLAMLPAVAEKLRAGDYSGALGIVIQECSPSEAVKAVFTVAQKIGCPVSEKTLQRFALANPALDVLWAEMGWAYEGLKALHEAHEAGDRDNRIAMYASAFAATFLRGEDAPVETNPVTDEEREAVAEGRRDGAATAGATGDLAPVVGKELLDRYGDEQNARRAIVDKLLERAGIHGVKLHEGA